MIRIAPFAILALLSLPISVHAQGGAVLPTCPPPPPEGPTCGYAMCTQHVAGATQIGMCCNSICVGTGYADQFGSGDAAITKGIADIFKGLLDKLMQGGQGGGGSGGGGQPPGGAGAGQEQCPSFYTVTVPTSDPCAIYNPNPLGGVTSGSSDISGSLLDALNNTSSGSDTETDSGGTSSYVSTILQNVSTTTIETNPTTSSTTGQSVQTPGGSGVQLNPELHGDVKTTGGGATIVVSSRDEKGNTEVAGFYGGGTLGSSAQSFAARMCADRPWANVQGFFGKFIPTSFLDGLCKWRGYAQGGTVPDVQARVIESQHETSFEEDTITTVATSAPTVQPEVEIWAEPESVRLGVRTYIFWNSRGVLNCHVTGPSFTQEGASGGASTVPLSDESTFSISCDVSDGTTIEDSVTVPLAL